MKNTYFLPALIMGLLISCDKDDNGINSPAGGTNKVSFVYNEKMVELDSFYANNITRISTNEVIGKHVSAYHSKSGFQNTDFTADFYFYTNGNDYSLYSVKVGVTEKYDSGPVVSWTDYYENTFYNDTDLNFTHNISNNAGVIQGEFNGKLTDHLLYDTISVSQGKIKFELP